MTTLRTEAKRLPAPLLRVLRTTLTIVRRERKKLYRPVARWLARRGLGLTRYSLAPPMGYSAMYGITNSSRASYDRDAETRWAMIASHLPASGFAMDLGCHNGWFTFSMADAGLYALGVEREESLVRASQWLTLHNQSDRVAFVRLDLTPDTVHELPSADVVLCLSVFHHWVRLNDFAYADRIMRGIADRCRYQLFFDTGQPNEPQKWAGALSFMGDSPQQWLVEFLTSLGFSEVIHLGDSPGFGGKSFRHLMMATR
jgi:hypothetical protein